MSNLILGISGCSGGNKGPAGLYKFLAHHTDAQCEFIALPTTPDDLLTNIDNVQKAVFSQNKTAEKDIYLMGYSMGGAVAAVSAYKTEQLQKGLIKGVILLAPQTEGLQALQSLDIPVLLIYGEQDEYFPPQALEKIFKELPQKKERIQIEQAKHNLMPEGKISSSNIAALAQKISAGVTSVFGFELLKTPSASQRIDKSWLASIFKSC